MQKLALVVVFLTVGTVSFCQDTIHKTFNEQTYLNLDYRNYRENLKPTGLCDYVNRYVNAENGYFIFHDSINDITRLQGSVLNRTKTGKWSYFDSVGNLRVEDVYLNNFDSVVYSSYFDHSGKLIKSTENTNNYCHLRLFDDYGLRFFRSENSDGDKTHTTFDSIGQIIYQAEYVNGLLHGTYLSSYDDGSLYAKRYYQHGKKTGIWIASFKGDTSSWCSEEYSNDILISISFYGQKTLVSKDEVVIIDRYENGSIRLEGRVKNGIKIGTWHFYDENGIHLAQFEHDEKGNITNLSGKLDGIPGI